MTISEQLNELLAAEMCVLDDDLRSGLMTPQEYEEHVDILHEWSNEFYRAFLWRSVR